MKERKQSSTTYPITFLLVSSSDHVTPVTGITPTVTISKDGASFASPSGAVSEIGNGWYKLAGNATDRNTVGTLLIHATGTGADPCDDRYVVVPYDPFDANLGLTNLDAAVSTRSTYAGGAVASVTGNVGGNVVGSVASVTGNVGGNVVGSVASVTAAVTVATNNDKTGYALTAAYDSAKTAMQAASYTAPDNATISSISTAVTAIKAITDTLGLTAIADAILKRDFSSVSGEASRSMLNALRAIRNKVSRSGSTITVTKEDDTASAWTAAITTDATAAPITTVDPV